MAKVIKHYCHAPSHPLDVFVGVDDDDVHLHLLKEHPEDVGTKDACITFIERYIEEVEC